MRQRISLILTLAAWLLATGSHWDLVQTYAWGRMVAEYARAMPFADAVAKTFSPQTMCPICHAVAEARQQESKDPGVPGTKTPEKILLVRAPASPGCVARIPTFVCRLQAPSSPLSADRAAPPVPPPRAFA